MISAASSQCFQPEWFNFVQAGDSAISYAIPKSEYQDLFNQTAKALQEQAEKNYESLTERAQASGTKVQLTEAQKRYLTENFDPEYMSRSEYQSFIDKLCEFGILDEQDKPYVGYGISGCDLDMTPISCMRSGAFVTPANTYNPMSYTSAFSSSGGDVLRWASYLSGTQAWDNGWKNTPESILFGRIKNVLEAVS